VKYLYTALFCEENIWHLANKLIQQGAESSELSIAFISNNRQQTVIFNQRSAKSHIPVIWDYHVILVQKSSTETLIYDFDSLSNFPEVAEQYLETSFPDEKNIPEEYQAHFRIVDAQTYIRLFSSDRSHMRGILPADKFPKYEAISKTDSDERITLAQFINFKKEGGNIASPINIKDFKKLLSV